MLLSRYLKAYPCQVQAGQHLIYSTKRSAFVMLPSEIWEQVQRGEIPPELLEPLTQVEILVADQEQEKAEVCRYLEQINLINPNLNVSVILGLDCNFACPYCYEGMQKGKHAMTDETADQAIAYIKARFTPGKKKLTLSLYGGETLLYSSRIKYLGRALKPFVEEQGGEFEIFVVTNGSLLTRKMVEELRPCGLKYAKVTVDGLAENHNRTRPFKNGRPSFELVTSNLKEVKGLIEIGIGGNYTRESYHYFPPLLDYFAEIGLTGSNLTRVKFDPVMQINDQFSLAEFHGGCASTAEPWLVDISLTIREETMKRGYHFPKLQPSPCGIDVEDSFTVHYDGSLYKCAALIGHEQFKVGDVWTGIKDFSVSHHLGHWQKEPQCLDCVYLPLCFGGCRYSEYQRSGSMARVDCMKDYLDQTLEAMLLQDIKYRYSS